MKTKQKIMVIAIVSVLLLAVIGLSIGLVLVAQQATMNNSMTISYTANNVDATITASGINYANATGTSDNDSTINIKDGETTKQSKTVTFNAEDVTSTGGVEFVNADLTASGRAVYTFEIKNTANSSNKKEMKALATFSGISDNDNVSIFIGETEASATEIKSATDKYFVNIGIGQATKTIVVVMKVTDATLDVNAFELNMEIELGYDLTDPNAFDWGDASGQVIVGVVNDSNINSTIVAFDDAGNRRTDLFNYTGQSQYVSAYTAPGYTDAIYIEFEVTGGAANYTIDVITPSGSKTSASDYFTGTYFDTATDREETDVEEYVWINNVFITIFDDNTTVIGFSRTMASFNPSLWEYGTKILITITPAE
ncbi:MAG: hypothetical protein E7361_01760 [Clostridiales bacterium]|nr:hypothetical protein [Clostridiales bacterium]